MARLVREYRKILSIAIAQTQTEQASSPSITDFTTQCACRNSAISDTSDDTIGSADCATSAGFISGILSTLCLSLEHDFSENRFASGSCSVPNPPGASGCRFRSLSVRRGCMRQRESLIGVAWGARPKPGPDSPANVSKRGLFARHYVPN